MTRGASMKENNKSLATMPGFKQLMEVQDKTEQLIHHQPESIQPILWEVYHNGQADGIVQGLLQVATHMKEAGYARSEISQLTQLPEEDIAMWEEALEGRVH